MTTPPPPHAAGGIPLRLLTAWALLALVAAILAFAFLGWIFPAHRNSGVLDRFDVDTFTQLLVLVAPLLAVLVATRLGPPLRHARLMGLIALIEYAVALVLGLLAFLLTLVTRFDGLDSGIYAFGGVLHALGGIVIDLLLLALLALAGLWTYQLFTGLGGRLPRLDVRTS